MLSHGGLVREKEGAASEHMVAVPACPAVIGDAQGERILRVDIPALPPQEQNPASLGAGKVQLVVDAGVEIVVEVPGLGRQKPGSNMKAMFVRLQKAGGPFQRLT